MRGEGGLLGYDMEGGPVMKPEQNHSPRRITTSNTFTRLSERLFCNEHYLL